MKKVVITVLLLLVGFLAYKYWPSVRGVYKSKAPANENIISIINSTDTSSATGSGNKTDLPLNIPKGYNLTVYVKDLVNPRDLILDSKGTLLASITGKQKVVAIVEGQTKTILGDLNRPHGLAFDGNNLYVAESDKVSVYDYDPENNTAVNKKKILDLPNGGVHFTRSLLIKDSKLFVSTGSSCNACGEKDPRRAAIWFANLDGTDFRLYAGGLRNSVFMTIKPGTDEIWATNMGRDNLGDNIPPETVNIIKEGSHYGWPYCYGNKITDKETNPDNKNFNCSKMEAPQIEFQAHSAPLGLAFLGNDLLIAYHGSWNRSQPTGYKVVKFVNGKEQDFVTGWLTSEGNAWGRPADILVTDNGKSIFISDDKAGVIYLLSEV